MSVWNCHPLLFLSTLYFALLVVNSWGSPDWLGGSGSWEVLGRKGWVDQPLLSGKNHHPHCSLGHTWLLSNLEHTSLLLLAILWGNRMFPVNPQITSH